MPFIACSLPTICRRGFFAGSGTGRLRQDSMQRCPPGSKIPQMKNRLDRFAAILLVVLCAIWGVQQVTIKIANAGISPLLQAGLRSLAAVLVVFAWSAWRGVKIFQKDGTLMAGLAAGVLFAAEFALIYWALNYTTASRGVIFLYTAPFFVALGAVWLLPNERLLKGQWLGMVLAFIGILALFWENLLQTKGSAWIGDSMMLAAALMWAVTTLVIKASRLARAAPEKTLLYQLAVSAVVLLPLSTCLDEAGITAITPAIIGAVIFQILVVASGSYLAWFWLISRYPATRLSAFSFLTPVFGVLAGGLILSEPLTASVVISLTLVGFGIWLANRRAA